MRERRQSLALIFLSLALSAFLIGHSLVVEVEILGFLPLSPFSIAWSMTRDGRSRQLWIVAAAVAFIAIVCWTLASDLTDFYDCDLNGVSLAIIIAPIVYTAATSAATLVLAAVRSLFLSATGRE